jgi:CDK inhibitor PHO81
VTNSKAPANFVALFEGFQQFDGDLNKLQVRLGGFVIRYKVC